jgi:hypothetical protein
MGFGDILDPNLSKCNLTRLKEQAMVVPKEGRTNIETKED